MFKALVVVALFALAVYLLVRVIQRRGITDQKRPGPGPGRSGRGAPRRPIAPDDDLDFLRDLDRKRKHPNDPET